MNDKEINLSDLKDLREELTQKKKEVSICETKIEFLEQDLKNNC